MKNDKHSHINADAEQRACIEEEYALADQNKTLNIFLIAAFFIFIYFFAVMFWIMPDKNVSETENRALQTFPAFSAKNLSDGTFTREFASYMADQFPFRDFFIGVKAASETALLKGQNNGVIISRDGYLITRYDSIDEKILENNLDCIARFKNAAEQNGISVNCAFAGRTMDVALSALPETYGSESSDAAFESLSRICLEKGIKYTDLLTPLREKFENGEYVYYRTDHHWTTLGAMYAYNAVAKDSGYLKPYDASDFKPECASDSFFGTAWSSAGVKWSRPDTIEFFRFENDDKLTTSIQGKESFTGLYDRTYLETKDKYTSFIGGNAPRTDVTSGESREKVLVIKDSFAHSVVPFIAREYDVTVIDLRYYSKPVLELCLTEGINKVIILYNMDTLSSEAGFRIFRMGLSRD